MRKILFLDIDGVLNSYRTCMAFGGYPFRSSQVQYLDQVAIKLLQRMCDSSGVEIVLSSTWRLSEDYKELGKALGLPIIDRTPSLDGIRGEEIQQWLDLNHGGPYVIVDDDSDMLESQMGNFVKTTHEEGYIWSTHVRVCEILGVSPFEGESRDKGWLK